MSVTDKVKLPEPFAWYKTHNFRSGVDYTYTHNSTHAEDWASRGSPLSTLYTEAQMLAMHEQGRLAGLEAAAAVCDRRGEEHHELARQDDKSVYHDDRGGACLDCADAIRSLATKKGDHLVDANKMIQERDELEKDATRYRAFFDGGMSVCFCGEVFYTKAECDAAIDAALAKQQEVDRG